MVSVQYSCRSVYSVDFCLNLNKGGEKGKKGRTVPAWHLFYALFRRSMNFSSCLADIDYSKIKVNYPHIKVRE